MTRDQERAQAAYKAITSVRNDKKKYGIQCLKLPALIQQCGLCQTTAFFRAKAKNDKNSYFFSLLKDLAHAMNANLNGNQTLDDKVRTADIGEYLHLTREALACAQWFKRYAEAILRVDSTDSGE